MATERVDRWISSRLTRASKNLDWIREPLWN